MTFYAPEDQVDQLDYAVETGKNVLEYFEKLFDIPYPLPKAGKWCWISLCVSPIILPLHLYSL